MELAFPIPIDPQLVSLLVPVSNTFAMALVSNKSIDHVLASLLVLESSQPLSDVVFSQQVLWLVAVSYLRLVAEFFGFSPLLVVES
jgi:hypothetical protein